MLDQNQLLIMVARNLEHSFQKRWKNKLPQLEGKANENLSPSHQQSL
jgi:hypothetical protein